MRRLFLTVLMLCQRSRPPGLRTVIAVGDLGGTCGRHLPDCCNLTYLTASNYESKLDIYYRRGATTPLPTVVYFHGGFWAAGNKEGAVMKILPWMEMGWNVVNVEYRLARVAPAPAAVEDGLCALRYLAAQAKTYMIDVNRIVTTGESAGGHLSLTSAMIPDTAGLDRQCAGPAACRSLQPRSTGSESPMSAT